jgi:hypothetical protein
MYSKLDSLFCALPSSKCLVVEFIIDFVIHLYK